MGASRRVVKKVDTRNREPLPEPDNVKKGDPMSVMHKPRHGWGSKQVSVHYIDIFCILLKFCLSVLIEIFPFVSITYLRNTHYK